MTWRPPALIFPDIEHVLTARIRTALEARNEEYAAGVRVSNKVPSPRPARLVTVRRDGGTATGLRDQPRVGINVWAESDADANDLTALVRAIIRGLPNGNPITAVASLGGPASVPDESGAQRRYFTAELHTRGVPL